ncbi:MAG: hypothetical protein CM15mP96_1360 [Gammaproteobacteria bacterium]|nr:MAG: hypothetical protein CM15mP96_1360 [Gammaproteobacteria bacterium]
MTKLTKKQITNHRIFALFEPQVEEGIDQDITIESVYRKLIQALQK